MSEYWYESFFRGIALDCWRKFATPELTCAEVDFLLGELAIQPGAHFLDVPCGNGRHAIEIASRGYRATGVDLASESIAEARAEAERRSLPVEFILSDMRKLPPGPFDAAYCMGNSFGYLEEGGQEEFLAAVAHALKPGARFILDSGHIAETLLSVLEFEKSYELGDMTLGLKHDYDAVNSVLRTEYSFIRNGVTERRNGEAHMYTSGELWRMLRRAGFEYAAAYGGIDRAPFRFRSPKLMLVAQLRSA